MVTGRIRWALAGLIAIALPHTVLAQATFPTPTGSRVSGTVPLQCDSSAANCTAISAANPLIVAATITPGGTQDVNLKQVAGATTAVGTGAADSGTQRVTTSTDSTIGTVTSVTSATVVQPIASALNATVAGTGTFAVQAAQAPSSASAAGVASIQSAAVETGHVMKVSAGNLYSFNVSADATLSAAAWAVMIFNSTTVPAAGAVTPVKCFLAPIGTTSISGEFSVPLYLSTGVSMAVSTGQTCFTKTDSAHGFLSANVQ